MAAAVERLGGAVLVLDEQLRILLATPGAAHLVGTAVPVGVSAPRLLCGEALERPIAEGLARGVPVAGTVERPSSDGSTRRLRVSATPLRQDGRLLGWVLLLGEASRTSGDPTAPVLFQGMWTRDPAMKQVFHVLERAAQRDATVLVRGETGTGKELIARALHDVSPRRAHTFAAINCAAVPGTLLESELFGHVRGAFTGALRDQPGMFRTADGGTLFLDEVAELPLELQAKLLRVLETHTVLPVGGSTPIPVDVRIVAATHQALRKRVEQGSFRADLMYRLRVIPLFVPPLRARPGDVALLTEKFVEELNAQGLRVPGRRQVTRVDPETLAVLERYAWPGNVRELRNALEYAYVIGEGPVLQAAELPPEILEQEEVLGAEDRERANVPPPAPRQESAEALRIRRALERASGHRERAAQILGISRVTLWRRMRELGLDETL